MHSSLILLIAGFALWVRWHWQPQPSAPWHRRWQSALVAFCLPPLLLLSIAGAVIHMGHSGTMLGLPVGQLGCWVAMAILLSGAGMLAFLLGQEVRSRHSLQRYAVITLPTGETARCLPTESPLAAQVGFLAPQLVVSQGLLRHLNLQEIQAILTHEQAHRHYRDTFWFFWLGWLRRLTFWLPNTLALWQELLLLRELRADQWAANRVDPLLLAELLLKLVAFPLNPPLGNLIAFSQELSAGRLEQRVDALLAETHSPQAFPRTSLLWLLAPLTPLATIFLHS